MFRCGVVLLFLSLLVLIALVMSSCDLTERRYYEIMRIEYAEEQSDSVSVREYRDGVLERVMNATKIERYYEKKQMVSYDVSIKDYFIDGSIKMTLVADTLIVDEVLNIYTAKGGVVIVRDEGTLKTEYMVWNQHTDEIFSPVLATIIRGENVLRGYELITNTEFTEVEMKRVTAEGIIDEETFDW